MLLAQHCIQSVNFCDLTGGGYQLLPLIFRPRRRASVLRKKRRTRRDEESSSLENKHRAKTKLVLPGLSMIFVVAHKTHSHSVGSWAIHSIEFEGEGELWVDRTARQCLRLKSHERQIILLLIVELWRFRRVSIIVLTASLSDERKYTRVVMQLPAQVESR